MGIFGGVDDRIELQAINNVNRQKICRTVGSLLNLKTNYQDESSWKRYRDVLAAEYPGASARSAGQNAFRPKDLGKQSAMYGTAFVLRDHPDIIVTAGHNLRDPTNQSWYNLEDLRFVLRFWYDVGNDPAGSLLDVDFYEIAEILYVDFNRAPNGNSDGRPDYAFLKLKNPIELAPDKTILPTLAQALPNGVAPFNVPIWCAGYGGGLPLQYGEAIYGGTPDAANSCRHNLPTFEGNSGCPIFNGNNEIIALHVSNPFGVPSIGRANNNKDIIVNPITAFPDPRPNTQISVGMRSDVFGIFLKSLPDGNLVARIEMTRAFDGAQTRSDGDITVEVQKPNRQWQIFGTIQDQYVQGQDNATLICTVTLNDQNTQGWGFNKPLDFKAIRLSTASPSRNITAGFLRFTNTANNLSVQRKFSLPLGPEVLNRRVEVSLEVKATP